MDKSLTHYIEEAEGHIALARLALHDMQQKITGTSPSLLERQALDIYQAIESYGIDLHFMLEDLEKEQKS